MHITVLSGGIGGARFLRGLLHHLDSVPGGPHRVSVIGNTADDITLHGLRVCPDLDTVMYTLGGGVHPGQGWGRDGETTAVAEELKRYGSGPDWFTLGDRDIATHLVRSRMLGLGYRLGAVTTALSVRWKLGSRHGTELLPMTEDPVETHVVIDDPDSPGGQRAIHFQEWWVRYRAELPARRIVVVGVESAAAGPGVLEAIRGCDVVLLPPSNPVVSIGTILAVPGVRDALRGTRAPVVGLSPVVGGAPVRGMADACLRAVGVATTARAVGGLFADLLDAWLVDVADAQLDGSLVPGGRARIHALPLLMTDLEASAEMARAALDLAKAAR